MSVAVVRQLEANICQREARHVETEVGDAVGRTRQRERACCDFPQRAYLARCVFFTLCESHWCLWIWWVSGTEYMALDETSAEESGAFGIGRAAGIHTLPSHK